MSIRWVNDHGTFRAKAGIVDISVEWRGGSWWVYVGGYLEKERHAAPEPAQEAAVKALRRELRRCLDELGPEVTHEAV